MTEMHGEGIHDIDAAGEDFPAVMDDLHLGGGGYSGEVVGIPAVDLAQEWGLPDGSCVCQIGDDSFTGALNTWLDNNPSAPIVATTQWPPQVSSLLDLIGQDGVTVTVQGIPDPVLNYVDVGGPSPFGDITIVGPDGQPITDDVVVSTTTVGGPEASPFPTITVTGPDGVETTTRPLDYPVTDYTTTFYPGSDPSLYSGDPADPYVAIVGPSDPNSWTNRMIEVIASRPEGDPLRTTLQYVMDSQNSMINDWL